MSLDFSLKTPGTQFENGAKEVRDVIIIGSGPAGLAAALYTARANLKPLVITGTVIGGQIGTTSEVENYPGFTGETGPELVEVFQAQAERFGAETTLDFIESVDLSRRPFKLTGANGDYYAKALIVSTGASYRKLGIPGEEEFAGRGVSYCATCDGFFFTGKEIVVVGGGDSALEEAIFLTRFGSKVTVIHRRDELRAGPLLESRARKNEKIKFIWDTMVTKINGDTGVTGLDLENLKTGQTSTLPAGGVFIAIGHIPNSALFKGQLEIDDQGYLISNKYLRTNIEGVWAAGEITDSYFRQAITSAGLGAAAAIDVERWLTEQEDQAETAETAAAAA
jgi:thioredoxin reductase (NADPH)